MSRRARSISRPPASRVVNVAEEVADPLSRHRSKSAGPRQRLSRNSVDDHDVVGRPPTQLPEDSSSAKHRRVDYANSCLQDRKRPKAVHKYAKGERWPDVRQDIDARPYLPGYPNFSNPHLHVNGAPFDRSLGHYRPFQTFEPGPYYHTSPALHYDVNGLPYTADYQPRYPSHQSAHPGSQLAYLNYPHAPHPVLPRAPIYSQDLNYPLPNQPGLSSYHYAYDPFMRTDNAPPDAYGRGSIDYNGTKQFAPTNNSDQYLATSTASSALDPVTAFNTNHNQRYHSAKHTMAGGAAPSVTRASLLDKQQHATKRKLDNLVHSRTANGSAHCTNDQPIAKRQKHETSLRSPLEYTQANDQQPPSQRGNGVTMNGYHSSTKHVPSSQSSSIRALPSASVGSRSSSGIAANSLSLQNSSRNLARAKLEQSKQDGAQTAVNSVHQLRNLLQNGATERTLASPADTQKLKRYSAKNGLATSSSSSLCGSPSKPAKPSGGATADLAHAQLVKAHFRQPTSARKDLSVKANEHRTNYFLDSPAAKPKAPRSNGLRRPTFRPMQSTTKHQPAVPSALASRYACTDDEDDEEGSFLEVAMRKHTEQSALGKLELHNTPKSGSPLSQSLKAGFDDNDVVMASDNEVHTIPPTDCVHVNDPTAEVTQAQLAAKSEKGRSTEAAGDEDSSPGNPFPAGTNSVNACAAEQMSIATDAVSRSTKFFYPDTLSTSNGDAPVAPVTPDKQLLQLTSVASSDRSTALKEAGNMPLDADYPSLKESPTAPVNAGPAAVYSQPTAKAAPMTPQALNSNHTDATLGSSQDETPYTNTIRAFELCTPSLDTPSSVDLEALLAPPCGDIPSGKTETMNDHSKTELGSRYLSDDSLRLLDTQKWPDCYGSSRATSSSPHMDGSSHMSVITIGSSQSATTSELYHSPNNAHAKLGPSDDTVVALNQEMPIDNNDAHEDVIWLGDQRTGEYEQKAVLAAQEETDPCVPTSHFIVGTDVEMEPEAKTKKHDEVAQHGQQQSNARNAETTTAIDQAGKDEVGHEVGNKSKPPPPMAPPPPPAKPESSAPTKSSRIPSWVTPRTPAMSDERGISSQMNVTPSSIFHNESRGGIETLKSRPKPASGSETDQSHLQARAKPTSPRHETALDDPEVVEGWDRVRQLKRKVEDTEIERKKKAELQKQEKEHAKLEKRMEKASKPAVARQTNHQRTPATKPDPTPSMRQNAFKNIEQRARAAKSRTKNKVERPFGADRVGKELNQALSSFEAPGGSVSSEVSTKTKTCNVSTPKGKGRISNGNPPPSTPPSVPRASSLYEPSTPKDALALDPFHQQLINSPSSDQQVNEKLSAYYESVFREKERRRPAGTKKHKFAALNPSALTPEDLAIMRFRSCGLAWKDVHKEYETRSGRSIREDEIRHRYTRLISTINEYLLPGNELPVGPLREQDLARSSSPAEVFTFDEDGTVVSSKPGKGKGKGKALNDKGHSTTAGKSIDPAVWAKVYEAYTPTPTPTPEPESPQTYSLRESSPLTESDKLHFFYQAILRTIALDCEDTFDDAEAIDVSSTTSSISVANDAAAKAFLAQPRYAPYNSHTHRFVDGKALWEGVLEAENKQVQVRVEQGLRTFIDDVLPESKEGWVARTCYIILERTMVFQTVNQRGTEIVHEVADDTANAQGQEDTIDWGDEEIGSIMRELDAAGDEVLQRSESQTADDRPSVGQKRLPISQTYPNVLVTPRPTAGEKRLPTSTSQPAIPASAPIISHTTSSNRRVAQNTQEVLKHVYTCKDMANREASRHLSTLQKHLGHSSEYINEQAAQRASMLDDLHERDEEFELTLELDLGGGQSKKIKVWVECVELRGPRNI